MELNVEMWEEIAGTEKDNNRGLYYGVRWPLGATYGKTKMEALEHLREMGHRTVDRIIGHRIGSVTGKLPDYTP